MSSTTKGVHTIKKCNVLGIDLAKNVIQDCLVDEHSSIIYNKAVSPNKLKTLLAKLSHSIVVMEGCGSCHYWGQLAEQFQHDVRIISPKKIKAFLQGHKTDANDALAIAVAATQPGMVFSRIKTQEQQSLQMLEKSRKFLDKELTALGNHIRAYLYEFGITTAKGRKSLRHSVQGTFSDINRLPSEPKTIKQQWLLDLVKRVGIKRACIALANKTVSTACALLATGKAYQPMLLSPVS